MQITVAIPTRNRGNEAIRSARSILDQDKTSSTQVIISDNSDPDQKSLLEAKVRDLPYKNIRYISPPQFLPYAEHWGWIANQIDGDYVGYLTDRMAWRSGSLEALQGILQKHRPESLSYVGYGAIELHGQHWLQRAPFTNRVYSFRREEFVSQIRQMKFPFNMPCMLNCFVTGETLRRVFRDYKNPFGTCVGDVGAASCFLDAIELSHYWDFPLYIAGDASKGLGAGLSHGIASKPTLEFVDNLTAKGGLTNSPIPQIVSNMNLRTHEYLRMVQIQKSGKLLPINFQDFYNSMERERRLQRRSFPEHAGRLLEDFRVLHGLNELPQQRHLTQTIKSALKGALNQLGMPQLSKLLKINIPGSLVGPFDSFDDVMAFDALCVIKPGNRGSAARYWS